MENYDFQLKTDILFTIFFLFWSIKSVQKRRTGSYYKLWLSFYYFIINVKLIPIDLYIMLEMIYNFVNIPQLIHKCLKLIECQTFFHNIILELNIIFYYKIIKHFTVLGYIWDIDNWLPKKLFNQLINNRREALISKTSQTLLWNSPPNKKLKEVEFFRNFIINNNYL